MTTKHTTGKWYCTNTDEDCTPSGYPKVWCNGLLVCEVYEGEDNTEREANARLIAEAGTVASETGMTPRQLADQRKELLEVCKCILQSDGGSYDLEPYQSEMLINAINKCESGVCA